MKMHSALFVLFSWLNQRFSDMTDYIIKELNIDEEEWDK